MFLRSILLVMLMNVTLLHASASPVPAFRPSNVLAAADSACGADAPDGMILYHALDAEGHPAEPELALVDPTGVVHRPVAVADARGIYRTRAGCKAVVQTAAGENYLVDGTTGDAAVIDLSEFGAEMQYIARAGGKAWGLFEPDSFADRGGAVLVNFITGQIADLFQEDTKGLFLFEIEFSPSGDYLVIPSTGATVLVPLAYSAAARQIGNRFSNYLSFDAAETRILYSQTTDDEVQQLVLESISGDTSSVIASQPNSEEDLPFLKGRFLAGRDDLLAVTYGDRLAKVELIVGIPHEIWSIGGVFGGLWATDDGRHGLLFNYLPIPADVASIVQPAVIYINLEDGAQTPVVDDNGAPMWLVTGGDRWRIFASGPDQKAPESLWTLDMNNGKLTRLLDLGEETFEACCVDSSPDGRAVLVTTKIEGGRERLRLFDAKTGSETELASADSITAQLSPNGNWAVYATSDGKGDQKKRSLHSRNIATQATVGLGSGTDPRWLQP